MVNKVRTRGVWGRMTAPARVKNVKRRKENANPECQDHLKKHPEKHQAEENKAASKSNSHKSIYRMRKSDAKSDSKDKPQPGDSDTGNHVDIRI
jgi:hypothetical protein